MADQLRPYLNSPDHARDEDEEGDTPLLTISDINPDMLEVVTMEARSRAHLSGGQ